MNLERILDVRGVRGAALVSEQGEVLAQLGFPADVSLAGTGRAVAQSMSNALGGGELRDLLIDFEDGPVLLTAVDGRVLITTFNDIGLLGRVRYAVKRAVAEAVAAS